jgi:heme exporter protein B
MNMAFSAMISRDLRLFAARGSEAAVALVFFAVVASLFPFALAQEPGLLRKSAAGIVWVAALLASLLSLDQLYLRDAEDGTLDLLLMSGVTPFRLAAAKMASHWLLAGAPLAGASFIVSIMLDVPPAVTAPIALSLALGTLYLSLLGGAGAALVLGSRRSGLLLAVLVLPLFVPMLILGVMAGSAALADAPYQAYVLLQLALVVVALPVAPALAGLFFNLHLRSS